MPVSPPYRNAVLNHLSTADLEPLLPHLERIDLPLRYRLADAGQPISMIRGSRGVIEILDRTGLLEQSNGYYGVAEPEMLRLFGEPNDPR